jgi:hypothetical protein
MAFTPASNWRERGLQAQAIKDKCNSIISRLRLPRDDARGQAMVHVRQMCNTLGAVPIKLQQSAENPRNVPALLSLLGLSSVPDLQSVLRDLNKNAKVSFLTTVQFALEPCIEQVLDALPGESRTFRLGRTAARLVLVAGVEPAQAKLDRLRLPAWMRNTLHNNGIHLHESKRLVVDGEAYVFLKGQRLECGSWSHIFHAVMCALDVYEEIFASATVSQLRHIPVG